MANYSIILFDMDGTLTDPTREMLRAAEYALEHFDIRNIPDEKLRTVLDLPLLHCFEEVFGLTRDQADRAFQHFWYHAGTFGPALNDPYEGVSELLAELKRRGKRLCVATARKTRNAEQILRAAKLDDYFDQIMGVTEDDMRRTKKMVIFDLLCDQPEHLNEDVIMVGDRAIDIVAARDNGIDSLGVTFGQEPPQDVRSARPTYLANTPKEMAEILLANAT